MANTRSAAKQARAAVRRRARNRVQISARPHLREENRALAKAGKPEEAAKLLPEFQSQIDRAAKKGVVHKNTASPPQAARGRPLQEQGLSTGLGPSSLLRPWARVNFPPAFRIGSVPLGR